MSTINLFACAVLAGCFVIAQQSVGRASDRSGLSAPQCSRTGLSPAYPAPSFASDLPGLPPVHFCGEVVPLHEERVARRLISALSRNSVQATALVRMRQRAAAFFPLIEPILAKYHIPADFKYLPLVESALVGLAVSPKGAAGYWQLMPATARELGLVVEPARDERLHLMRATDAACRYLRFLYNRLGSWTLAAAAYNNGIGNLLGTIQKQQRHNYYYLRLNAETGKYLYRILAFKELFSNHGQYRDLLTERMLTSLNRPVSAETQTQASDVLFNEAVLVSLEREAVATPAPIVTICPPADRPEELPLPNAADVFRGGIQARLIERGDLKRGSVWVFNLTRNSMANDVTVSEGDRLYAVVEDIDTRTGRIFFRADKLYAAGSQQTLPLPLAAVDAATGRVGIPLPAIDQLKAGWTIPWKIL